MVAKHEGLKQWGKMPIQQETETSKTASLVSRLKGRGKFNYMLQNVTRLLGREGVL